MLETYGTVMDVQIMTEKNTDKPRGFGFAILEDFDSVDKLCIKKYHRIRVKLYVYVCCLAGSWPDCYIFGLSSWS